MPREASAVASAPGKVILFGEHAVVHGKVAVAAAVSDLRIVVQATATTEDLLRLELPDLSVCFRCLATSAASHFAAVLATAAPGRSEPQPPSARHLELLDRFLVDQSKQDKKALLPLVFLCTSVLPSIFVAQTGPVARGLHIKAYSASLPVGAGLGSSAAFCVATAAALLRLGQLLEGAAAPDNSGVDGGGSSGSNGDRAVRCQGGNGSTAPQLAELRVINDWAFAAETIVHGNPSGLDNTVSCFGGAIEYVRTPKTIEHISPFPALDILLTDTRVPRETSQLVGGVGALLERLPTPTVAMFDAIEAVGRLFLSRVRSASAGGRAGGGAGTGRGPGKEKEGEGGILAVEEVGQLMRMNHHLLCGLGVGHPALDRVCALAEEHGAWSKLTGAGGGGCALTLLGGGCDAGADGAFGALDGPREALIAALEEEGFRCFQSTLGGAGVLWHEGEQSLPPPPPPPGRGGGSLRGRGRWRRLEAVTWVRLVVVLCTAGAVAAAAVASASGRTFLTRLRLERCPA